MPDIPTEKYMEVEKRLLPKLTKKYVTLYKNKEELLEKYSEILRELDKLRERNAELEEQHENDELAIEYYKRAECPFYQHEGKCVDEVKKSDLKPIYETQFRRKRNGG